MATTTMEQKRQPPPDPLWAVLGPALKTGAACGGAGFLIGGLAGTLRNTSGILFGAASGIQTFILGTTFSASRTVALNALQAHGSPIPTDWDRMRASAIGGSVSGGLVGYLARGRSNAIAGAVMFALIGSAGQYVDNRFNAKSESAEPKQSIWKKITETNWSPVKLMTDEEYADLLREKLLKVDVEIAVLDDKIAAIKAERDGESSSK